MIAEELHHALGHLTLLANPEMVCAGDHVVVGWWVESSQLLIDTVGVDEAVAVAGDNQPGGFVGLQRAVGDGFDRGSN